MIRAGLRPSSAMSTMATSADSSPSPWRTRSALRSGTATRTASPRARLARMKPQRADRYSPPLW